MTRSVMLLAMPQDDAITPARQRLGKLIDDRREALGLSQREVARHSLTYANLAAGRPVKPETIRRAFRMLGWDPASIPDVLDGGQPRELSGGGVQVRSSDTEGEVRVAFEELGRVTSGWPAMSAERRQQILKWADDALKNAE